MNNAGYEVIRLFLRRDMMAAATLFALTEDRRSFD